MQFFAHAQIAGRQYIDQQYVAVYNEAMFIVGEREEGRENSLHSKITAKDFCFTSKINHSGKA